MENKYSSSSSVQDTTLAYLIRLIYQWRKFIGIMAALSLVISTITVYLILPVYYKSTAIFYPLNSRSYDPRFMDQPASYDLYGGGDDADRVLSIGKSAVVRDYVIQKYNLARRYDIDTTSAEGRHRIKLKYEDNFDLKENERGALELTFFDKSADTAAIIVNDILSKINEINLGPTITSNKSLLESHLSISYEHTIKVDSMIVDYKKQKGAQAELAEEMMSLERFHDLSLQRQLKRKMELLDQNPSTLFVIEKARADYKKARPMRLVTISLSVIGSLIFALALAALMENIKALKEQKMI